MKIRGLGAVLILAGFVCALLALWGLLIIVGPLDSVGTHPVFGKIRVTMASDLNEARSDPVGRFLREHLPRKVVSSPSFPYRFKDQPRYLEIEGVPMEWSIGSPTTGWLYFWQPHSSPRVTEWEFAPSDSTNLLELTTASLPSRFFGDSHSEIQRAFGTTSTTNALNVQEGQIVFARRSSATNTIYILHLEKQEGNRLMVHYCSVPR